MGTDLLADAGPRLHRWLEVRVRDRSAIGYVAERDSLIAGFLLGRMEQWESEPPILKARRLALIDMVVVVEKFRRQGVATALVHRVIKRAESSGASGIETTFQVDEPAATGLWNSLGFTSTLTRAHLTIDS
jgi:ribosomal protein S18 acetylase RimI-like enzyme